MAKIPAIPDDPATRGGVISRVLDLAHKILPDTAPAGAPHEVSQPLAGDARVIPTHLRGMEKELAPLTYPESTAVAAAASAGVVSATPPLGRPPVPIAQPVVHDPLPGVVADAVRGTAVLGPRTTAPIDNMADPPEPHQPAASNSESPSRGTPTPARDPSLQPTGGFGPVPGLEYIPLDGSEVRQLVLGLMDQIAKQMETDLRFVRALTYPRLDCRVTVDVGTFPPESAVRITKILPDPKGQASRAIALQHADECCFVVMAQRQEMNAAGESIDPPDKIRDALQLPKPHVQVVGSGVARQLVDVASEIPAAPVRPIDVNGMPVVPVVPAVPVVDAPQARQAVIGAGGTVRPSPGPEAPPRSIVGGAG